MYGIVGCFIVYVYIDYGVIFGGFVFYVVGIGIVFIDVISVYVEEYIYVEVLFEINVQVVIW